MSEQELLSSEELHKITQEKLEAYENFSLLESYAMFMGKAQLLEFGLKGLLNNKFDVSIESTEKWTLGMVKKELENKGLREDFVSYLSGVVDHRNYIAHEFLLQVAISKSLANFSNRKLFGELFRAVYGLEQLLIMFDLFNENNSW